MKTIMNELMTMETGVEIFESKVDTLQQAEQMLLFADNAEGMAFWTKGKAWKAIKDGIDVGKAGFNKYKDLKDYHNQLAIANRPSLPTISNLILAYEYIEQLKNEGVPIEELPKNEYQVRVKRLEYKMPKKKAAAKADMEMAREAVRSAHDSHDAETVSEVIQDHFDDTELERIKRIEAEVKADPQRGRIRNGAALGQGIEAAGSYAKKMNDILRTVYDAYKAGGTEIDEGWMKLHYENAYPSFLKSYEILTKILNK